MNTIRIFAVLGFALVLSGCQTFAQNAWNDLKNIEFGSLNNMEPLTNEERSEAQIQGRCPKVVIVEELSSISEFQGSKMNDSMLATRAFMEGVESNCRHEGGHVAVDLRLAFMGHLGPKGRLKSGDKPYFSYPFFVAVTDQERNILAKEIFSASVTFNRDEDHHTYYESLRQLIPVQYKSQAGEYTLMLGFQLTPEQLSYNRRNIELIRAGADGGTQ